MRRLFGVMIRLTRKAVDTHMHVAFFAGCNLSFSGSKNGAPGAVFVQSIRFRLTLYPPVELFVRRLRQLLVHVHQSQLRRVRLHALSFTLTRSLRPFPSASYQQQG